MEGIIKPSKRKLNESWELFAVDLYGISQEALTVLQETLPSKFSRPECTDLRQDHVDQIRKR